MTEQTALDWPPCGEDGCNGVRLATTPKCLVHTSDEERNAALKQFSEAGELDARGVPITTALFEWILAAAPRDADNRPTFRAIRLDKATFQGDAGFDGATFQGDAWFAEATFQGDAGFGGATFQGDAGFDGATFQRDTGFDGATFQGDTGFFEATFQRDAWFAEATFQRGAGFGGATFQGGARFDGATFQGDIRFHEVSFQRDAEFAGASFQGNAWFDGATFQRDAEFGGATFEQARQFGPFLAHRELHLDDVQFAQPVQIEASTIGVCCRRARFAGGVQFRLRWARVVLDDTDLAAPSILAGIPRLTSGARVTGREQRIAKAWQRLLAEDISERPRLLSLRRANVAGLGLSSVELADCRFAGAHNLDRLRLEADVSFAAAPVRLRWDWRQVIAEERAWRAQRSRRWPSPLWPTSAWLGDEPVVLEAGQIAGLYRALRKGREDAKDEPGAADFYYGEMEMRRRARRRSGEPSRGRVERAILTAYWLVSGYGLRAWRALAWLLVAVMVATIGLRTVGFTHDRHPWSSAFLYTAGAVTHLVNPPDGLLTEPGQAIRIAIGLLGPLLLGLALLAVRGRVKR
jgi:Pentapeptide repeats (9 copies)